VGVVLASRALSLYAVLRELGDSPAAVLAAELLATAAILAVPSFCMGAAFSHLAHWARVTVGQIGHAVAVNTIGAAGAPALCGVVVIPLLGAKWTMVLLGFGYLVLLPARPKPFVSLLSGIACLGAMAIHLRILAIPPGAQVVHYAEGTTASVAVIEEGNSRTLRVDNSFQMGGTGAADTEYLQAHIPLLLHPAPRRALFLGLGTGISFGAASLYPQVHADGAELLPEVAQAMSFFVPQNFAPREQPNLSMHIADARRFVRNASQVYDVIIGDVFHPYRDGAGALYTREHFAAVHRRLAPAGIFCQWLPLHQIDEPTLRVIVHTFQQEFPSAEAWLLRFNVDVPVMALIGSGGRVWSTRAAESRGKNERLEGELKRLAISDSLRLYGHLLAEAEDLRRFADGAPLNTDDDQRVTFMAPRFAYRKNAKPYSSLLALLNVSQAASSAAGHFKATDGEFAQRLAKYLTARNVYLRGLVDAAEHREMGAVAAYVESARISPDFTSGYAQCLSLVSIIANSNPVRAREILTALDAAQPERPVAREMLQRLFAR
jgi:spermidine synthase